MKRARPVLLGAMASVGVHASVALLLITLPTGAERAEERLAAPYDVEVTPVEHARGTAGADRRGSTPNQADRAVAGGDRRLQNIDAEDPGQGGDATGALVAIRLLENDDRVLLFDSPLNNLAAGQTQRIRTARDRATLERRRATPNPNDQAFLASGDGVHQERRPVRADDSAEGARAAPTASIEGALPSVAESGVSEVGYRTAAAPVATGRSSAASRDLAGVDEASPGTGILAGRGVARTEAARVAHGRPAVDRGPAATNANRRSARVRDDQDAENLAAEMWRSLVDATARTSRNEGAGRGGVTEGGAPGSGGGTREGGRASPYGPGAGRYAALDTRDSRYRRWFLQNSRRVWRALRFPRRRALEMDQGTSIYMVQVRRDGTLVGAPRLLRTSGFDDMDRAALHAIRRATPFSPIPRDLAPHLARISIRLPIEFSNPMVR